MVQQPATGLPIRAALEQVLKHALENKRKFNESVDLALRLGVDPRKPNQSVRGVQTLPNGTGKRVRVAVFARGQVGQGGATAALSCSRLLRYVLIDLRNGTCAGRRNSEGCWSGGGGSGRAGGSDPGKVS